jgi:hypothetical protein
MWSNIGEEGGLGNGLLLDKRKGTVLDHFGHVLVLGGVVSFPLITKPYNVVPV